MKIKNIYISSLLLVASLVGTTSCNDFLERDLQGTSDEGQTISPDNVDNLVIAAYAHMVSGEDMNSPFAFGRMEMSVQMMLIKAGQTPKTVRISIFWRLLRG